MYITIGQLGLGNLSEADKREFLDYLNSELQKEGIGSATPVTGGKIRRKGLFADVQNAESVIQMILYAPAVVGAAKRLPYFYQKARSWATRKGRDTSQMEMAGRLAERHDRDVAVRETNDGRQ